MRAVLFLAFALAVPTISDATFVLTPDVSPVHMAHSEPNLLDDVLGPFDFDARISNTHVSKIENGKTAEKVARMFFDRFDMDESGDLDAIEFQTGLFDGSRLDYTKHSDLQMFHGCDMDEQDVLAFVGAWDRDDSATLDRGEARDTSLRNQFSATSMLAMKSGDMWKCISGSFTDVGSCSDEMNIGGCKATKLLACAWSVVEGAVAVVGCAAGKIIDGFVTVFTECWKMLVKAVSDEFGSISDFFTAAFAECDSVKSCLDAIIECGVAVLKWLGKMIENLILELLGPLSSGYVLVKEAVVKLVRTGIELAIVVFEIAAAIAKFIIDSVAAIAAHMTTLPNLCTPPGVELPRITPSDCHAFAYVVKIFEMALQLSFQAVGANFDAAITAFGSCLTNLGLFSIPSPFMFLSVGSWCVWAWLEFLVKCLLGCVIYFVQQVMAVVNGCESQSDQDQPLCQLVLDLVEIQEKIQTLFASDASFFESGSDAAIYYSDRRGKAGGKWDCQESAGDFQFFLEFGATLTLEPSISLMAFVRVPLGIFILMVYVGGIIGQAYGMMFGAVYWGIECQFRFFGNKPVTTQDLEISLSGYILIGFWITTNKMKTPAGLGGSGIVSDWAKYGMCFRMLLSIENFLGTRVGVGIMISLDCGAAFEKLPPVGFALCFSPSAKVEADSLLEGPKRYHSGPWKQKKVIKAEDMRKKRERFAQLPSALVESNTLQEIFQSSSAEGQFLGGFHVAVKMISKAKLSEVVAVWQAEPLSLFRFSFSVSFEAEPEFQIKFCFTTGFAFWAGNPGAEAAAALLRAEAAAAVRAATALARGRGRLVSAHTQGIRDGDEYYMYNHQWGDMPVHQWPGKSYVNSGSWLHTCGMSTCGNHHVSAKKYNFGPDDNTGRWKVVMDASGVHYFNGYPGSGYLAFSCHRPGCNGGLYGVTTFTTKKKSTVFEREDILDSCDETSNPLAVWNKMAGAYTCGARIAYCASVSSTVDSCARDSLQGAKDFIAGEFPSSCGPCADTWKTSRIRLKQPAHNAYIGACGTERLPCSGYAVRGYKSATDLDPVRIQMTLQMALTVPYGGAFIQDSEGWLLYNPGLSVFATWCGLAGLCSATHGIYGYSKAFVRTHMAARKAEGLSNAKDVYLYGTSTNPNHVWIKEPAHGTWLGAGCDDAHCASHSHLGGESKHGVYAYGGASLTKNVFEWELNNEYVYIKNKFYTAAPYVGAGCDATSGRRTACRATHGMHLFATTDRRTSWIMFKSDMLTLPWNNWSDDEATFKNPSHFEAYLVMCGVHSIISCAESASGIYTHKVVTPTRSAYWTLKVSGISFQMVQKDTAGDHPMTVGRFLGFCDNQTNKPCGVRQSTSRLIGYKDIQGSKYGRWLWETPTDAKYTETIWLKNGYRAAVEDKYMGVCGRDTCAGIGRMDSYRVQGYASVEGHAPRIVEWRAR